MRSAVHTILKQERASRYAALGIPEREDEQGRWRCHNRSCLRRGRWWLSEYGVVNCMNCRPPQSPSLVVAEGEAHEAPFVEPDRSNQVRKSYPVPTKHTPTGEPPEVARPISHAITR